MKSLCTRALLALLLAGGAGAALAGPAYHVSVDTRSLSGDGYLDLTFGALIGATPATATLDRFSGAFGTDVQRQGDAAGGIGSTVALGNSQTFNELLQAVHYGGLFSFDVRFSIDGMGDTGTDFGVALTNAALTDYAAGTMGNIVTIGLMPGAPDTLAVADGFASVGEAVPSGQVPEPACALLFGSGLLLLAARRRRGATR